MAAVFEEEREGRKGIQRQIKKRETEIKGNVNRKKNIATERQREKRDKDRDRDRDKDRE